MVPSTVARGIPLEPLELARRVVEVALEKQAADIVLLDVRAAVSFTDYLVIMSAESLRQMASLAKAVELDLRPQDTQPRYREGTPDSGWMLLDYLDVVVHIFAPELRGYYRLEQVWQAARPLIRVQ